jgi:hypothetical protein
MKKTPLVASGAQKVPFMRSSAEPAAAAMFVGNASKVILSAPGKTFSHVF